MPEFLVTDLVEMQSTSPQPVLTDLLSKNLKIIFCGGAAGTTSAKKQVYYAGTGNKFWATLYEIGLTPRIFSSNQCHLLLDLGIGLTDMAKFVYGSDASLPKGSDDPARIHQIVDESNPTALAFVGKRAAKVFFKSQFGIKNVPYGIQKQTINMTELFVLPSPSGLAARYWDTRPWHELASHLQS